MAGAYSPPSRRRRVAVWLVGFVVTGKVFHDVSERDLGRLSAAEVAVHAGSMCVVLGAVAYALTVIPRGLTATVGAIAVGVALVLGGLPILAQWLVTKALELWQLRRARSNRPNRG